ncbi:hypothetical protein [Inhella sp.]|uniref:hypothetical protein n=1 Tax=Inhella sp. TaxID=1921806 RepID=UPI0035AE2B47
MQRFFTIVWLGCLLLFFVSSFWLPERVGDPGKEVPRAVYVVLMGFCLVSVPWFVGPGMVRLLQGKGSGGVNIPHAEYWFEGQRREASLRRLEPYLLEIGCLTAVFLVAVSASTHFPGALFLGMKLGLVVTLGLTALLLLSVALWMLRVKRAFPKPPTDALERPADLRRPRRPRRPGD